MEEITRALADFADSGGAAVARLRRLLHEGGPTALSDDELLHFLGVVEGIGRVIDDARIILAAEVKERCRPELASERLSHRSGCRSSSELLGRICAISGREARARMTSGGFVRRSRSLAGEPLSGVFPALISAVEAGVVDREAIRVIVGVLRPAIDHGASTDNIAAAEASLVGAATGVDDERVRAVIDGRCEDATPWSSPDQPRVGVDAIRVIAEAWALALDPDGAAPDEGTQLKRRGITIGRIADGTVRLTGELMPEVAAQLQLLIDAYLSPKVDEAAHGAPGLAPGDGGDSLAQAGALRDDDMRSPAQRRHDAFAGIVMQSARLESMPMLGGAAPTLVVAVDSDQLLPGGDADRRGEPIASAMTPVTRANAPGIAFLQGVDADYPPVPGAVARQIACAGAVQKVVMSPRGRIESISSPSRIFTAHQRRAIALRDGGCVIPGCSVRASWCEVHHVVEHSAGGATSTDNGVLLCWYHHRTLERNGWRITMEHGVPNVEAPGRIGGGDVRGRGERADGSCRRTQNEARAKAGLSRADRRRPHDAPTEVRGVPTPVFLPEWQGLQGIYGLPGNHRSPRPYGRPQGSRLRIWQQIRRRLRQSRREDVGLRDFPRRE